MTVFRILDRYSRQIAVIGEEGQRKLRSTSVVVFGVGGLGSHVSYYLAAGGFRRLYLVDSDRVAVSDLHRQVLYSTKDVGVEKAVAAASRLEQVNPEVDVVPISEEITPSLAEELVKKSDIAVDALDNWPSRHVVNKAAVSARKPLVHGAVQEWYGHITTIVPGITPCLEELFGRFKSLPACAQAGCPVLGPVVGTVAAIMAVEVFRAALGAPSLAGKLLIVDLKHMAFDMIQLQRDENCPVCRYVR